MFFLHKLPHIPASNQFHARRLEQLVSGGQIMPGCDVNEKASCCATVGPTPCKADLQEAGRASQVSRAAITVAGFSSVEM